MERYSVIRDKRPRELVLLRGSGCVYKRCAFCDYHIDCSPDEAANFALNSSVLARVTGEYGELEVINSGSVFELDSRTLALIKAVCAERNISVVHFETHYLYRNKLDELRREFDGFTLLFKLGLETFDYDLRENVLLKGIPDRDPAIIAQGFDEANFLFGLTGQTVETMRSDIELGLKYFKRICVNVMCENSTSVKPDGQVVSAFVRELYPIYKDDPRVDILISNLDFGVGEINN
ncbi:MAG: radical SAM protein [Clostridiales bacterium]|nr:radical SAM protein [Clostridiales bacterium]